MNRLNLDWTLTTRDERTDFITKYLESIPFTPTSDELSTMGNYILWGKNEEGKNGRQTGIQIDTKYGTWDRQDVDSLDALAETPGFLEASLRPLNAPATKIPRTIFSRSEARKMASSNVLNDLEALWRQIDETEYKVARYELVHGRRSLEIRPELLQKFDSAAINTLNTEVASLSQYAYLRLKHLLVELRQQQYTYRDSYIGLHITEPEPYTPMEDFFTFQDDIPVFPFPLIGQSTLREKVYPVTKLPSPVDFTESELKEISKLIWTSAYPKKEGFFFDFRDVEHLYELVDLYKEFREMELDENSRLWELLRAFDSYRHMAQLEPHLSDILDLKIQKKSNQEIADRINEKYGKTYKPNYISTLYCKKCLEAIAQAAADHRVIMENIFFEEEFKTCKDCGQAFLLNESNFVKRHRSKDGFSPRCKKCEKKLRESRK